MLEKKLRFDKKETCGFWGNRLIFWVVICLWVSVLGCREKEPSEAPMSSTPSVVVEPISLVITEPAKKAIEIDLQIAYSQQAMLWANGRLTTYSLLGQPQQGDPENPYSCAALLKFGQQELSVHKLLSGISHVCEIQPQRENFALRCNEIIQAEQDLCLQRAAMRNLIEISVAELNQIYKNSGLSHIRFRLVDVVELDESYVESYPIGNSVHADPVAQVASWFLMHARNLVRLRNFEKTDTFFQKVHQSRLNTKADLTILLVKNQFNFLRHAGIAADIFADTPKNTVAVLDINSAAFPRYIFSHEVSHLLGAHHGINEKNLLGLDIEVDPLGSAFFPDNHGFIGKTSSGQGYSTLMSACDGCVTLPFLSTPDVVAGLESLPLGSEVENNARVVGENAQSIAVMGEKWADLYVADTARRAQQRQRISVDFGFDAVNGFDYKADQHWNAVMNPQTGASFILHDHQGAATSVTLDLLQGFSGVGLAHPSAQIIMGYGLDEMPVMAMVDGFYSEKEAPSPVVVLLGLVIDAEYTVTLFASADVFDQPLKTQYIVTGTESVRGNLMVAGNMMRFLTFTQVTPSSSGTIEIRLSSTDGKSWLNALDLVKE